MSWWAATKTQGSQTQKYFLKGVTPSSCRCLPHSGEAARKMTEALGGLVRCAGSDGGQGRCPRPGPDLCLTPSLAQRRLVRWAGAGEPAAQAMPPCLRSLTACSRRAPAGAHAQACL